MGGDLVIVNGMRLRAMKVKREPRTRNVRGAWNYSTVIYWRVTVNGMTLGSRFWSLAHAQEAMRYVAGNADKLKAGQTTFGLLLAEFKRDAQASTQGAPANDRQRFPGSAAGGS